GQHDSGKSNLPRVVHTLGDIAERFRFSAPLRYLSLTYDINRSIVPSWLPDLNNVLHRPRYPRTQNSTFLPRSGDWGRVRCARFIKPSKKRVATQPRLSNCRS